MDFVGKFSNMQTMTQYGGVQQTQARRTEKQDETKRHQELQDQQPQKEKEEVKDSYNKGAQQEAPKTHERKTQQVVQHFVASTDQSKDAKKMQEQQDAKNARNAQDAQQPGEQKPSLFTPLDNSARIGLMYQQQQRENRSKEGVGRQDYNATQQQQNQLKRFLTNMREFVKTEYNQYTKPEISPYSRRNPREILSALGDDTKAFDNKALKDRRDRQTTNNATGETKKYNQHFDALARKDYRLFKEDPMNDPNYDAFEMFA